MTKAAAKKPKPAPFPDPEHCRWCGTKGRVRKSYRKPGYRLRRHWCPACHQRWTSYQSVIDPKRVSVRDH